MSLSPDFSLRWSGNTGATFVNTESSIPLGYCFIELHFLSKRALLQFPRHFQLAFLSYWRFKTGKIIEFLIVFVYATRSLICFWRFSFAFLLLINLVYGVWASNCLIFLKQYNTGNFLEINLSKLWSNLRLLSIAIRHWLWEKTNI